MLIHCIRHGESAYNAEGRIQGQTDVPLSPLGSRQSLAIAAAFEGQGIDAIYSSPLARALDTARAVADVLSLPVETDERLMEINIGVFQGVLACELQQRFPAEAARWRSHDPDFRVTGGESRRMLMQRGEAAFRDIRASGKSNVVVVSHGGLLSAAFKAIFEIPAERNPFTFYNASISTLSWDGELKLLTINNIEHLRSPEFALETRMGDL